MFRAGLVVALLALLPTTALARPVSQPEGWGIGLMLGSPTGINAKHWMGGANAVDLGLGTGPGLRFHADYLFGLAQLASNEDLTLDFYLGGGAAVGVPGGSCWRGYYAKRFCGPDGYLGVRVPLGLDMRLRSAPIDLGLEAAPGIWVGPELTAGLWDVMLLVRVLL